jgi:hypothetical protein
VAGAARVLASGGAAPRLLAAWAGGGAAGAGKERAAGRPATWAGKERPVGMSATCAGEGAADQPLGGAGGAQVQGEEE